MSNLVQLEALAQEHANEKTEKRSQCDGIDFPGDDCRLLFIEGLPKATNIQ